MYRSLRSGAGGLPAARLAFVIVAFICLTCAQIVEAKGRSTGGAGAGIAMRRGDSSGSDNSGTGGKMDTAVVSVGASFGGLAFIFMALTCFGKIGARNITRSGYRQRVAAAAAALSLPVLPNGTRVTLRHRGEFDIEGEGTVTSTEQDKVHCKVQWDESVAPMFSYKPRNGGPRKRVKRSSRVPRAYLNPIDQAVTAQSEHTFTCSAEALAGRWEGEWLEDGASRATPFAITLKASIHGVPANTVLLRTPPSAAVQVVASVGTNTGRVVLEFGRDTYFNGELIGGAGRGEVGPSVITGHWLGGDGTGGTLTIRQVDVAAAGAVPSMEVGVEGALPQGSARGRWRAIAAVAKTHGLLTMLRAVAGAAEDEDMHAQRGPPAIVVQPGEELELGIAPRRAGNEVAPAPNDTNA